MLFQMSFQRATVLALVATAALVSLPAGAFPSSSISVQSLNQISNKRPVVLTTAERAAALKRLSGATTPPAMGVTTTVTPSAPVRGGVAMGYLNAVAVVTSSGTGAAALQAGSSSPAGAVTLHFSGAPPKAYLIDCALDQYGEAAWSVALNGSVLSSGTGQIMSGHLSVLTAALKASGTLDFSASPPPGTGSQFMLLTSCSVTELG